MFQMLKLVQRAPFFIQLKYACTSINEYHFVMDYMPAGNLYNYMIGGTLTLSEAKICGAEILLALQYLHKHHVVYRDLKLENILIEAGGHILLTDFGLARTLKNNEKLTDKAGTILIQFININVCTQLLLCYLLMISLFFRHFSFLQALLRTLLQVCWLYTFDRIQIFDQ